MSSRLVGRSRRIAELGSHSVSIERRTGDQFTPIQHGGLVEPREPIRLVTLGVNQQLIHGPDFQILDAAGNEVFRRGSTAGLSGTAFLDISAPSVVGRYQFIVHAQSFPFLPFTHPTSMPFEVSNDAPPPATPPPSTAIGGIFGDFKTVAMIGLGIAALVLIGQVVSRTPKKA